MNLLSFLMAEAVASLRRGWRGALLAVATIGAALVVLGGLLVVTANLDRLVEEWSASAEFSVYFEDGASTDQRRAVADLLEDSPVVASHETVTKGDALSRFTEEFPDLSEAARSLAGNPLPGSEEVRLTAGADPDGVDDLATTLRDARGVIDVRYDRQWLERILSLVAVVRTVALGLALVPFLAAGLTVSSVVRLALLTRSEEVRTMILVGAPFSYVRGPLVMEGLLQGGVGAAGALVVLYAAFRAIEARYGDSVSFLLGDQGLTFLPAAWAVGLVVGGMIVGCLGAAVAATAAREAEVSG